MTRFAVLLRGVNVGGRSLPMAALREAARAGGFPDCATFIQSGNMVLSSREDATMVEERIEALIAAAFGMAVVAIARTAAALADAAATNPFPEAMPNRLHLGLTKRPIRADAVSALATRTRIDERVALVDGSLWIDFGGGVAGSNLTSAVLDRAAGSTLTARNWNTMQRLVQLAAA